MKKLIFSAITLLLLASCSSTPVLTNEPDLADQPTEQNYQVGEKWIWKYKGVTTKGEVRADGTDTREVISVNGKLYITIGSDTIPISEFTKPETSSTPKYDWPLKVGKKWTFETNWTSQDGTTGNQHQEAEVVAYKEETVEAGTFMAYTIHYSGTISNSRGYNAQVDEVWLYAPALKTFIKLTQTQDDYVYNEELIAYSTPN